MKKIMLIAGSLLMAVVLSVFVIVPALAQDDGEISQDAIWQQMREAHESGDWQAMYNLMLKLHGEDFNGNVHMQGNYHMGGMMGGSGNYCHDNPGTSGLPDQENRNEANGSPNTDSFGPGMMGGGSPRGMMGW